MLWPSVERRKRFARTLSRRGRPRPAGRDWQGGAGAGERLETRRMLAADITLVGNVLTVSFDDTSDDAVSLSITETGYEATGANVTSGTGTISQLVVLDAGTAKTSDFTLLQAAQILTGGLSIMGNVTAARFEDSLTTSSGAIILDAPTTLAAITLASGSGDQSFAGGLTLAGDAVIESTGGGNVAFSGGVTTAAGQTAGLTVNAGTLGAVTFSNAATTVTGSVVVTARNIEIDADLVSTSGDISLVGYALTETPVAGTFHGVLVRGRGVEVATRAENLLAGVSGSIFVSGRGGDAVAAGFPTDRVHGVYVHAGAAISAGGSGSVVVRGTGGISTASFLSGGVFLSNSDAANGVSEIRSAGGDVFVEGTAGGAPDSSSNAGVQVNRFGRIAGGGSGRVTVIGTGTATGGSGSSGVVVVNGGTSLATPTAAITSADGGISVTGTAADGAAGVVLLNEGSIASGGANAVTIFADSLTLGTDSGIGAGTITAGAEGSSTLQIVPRTAGTRIDIGGDDVQTGTRTLGLSVAEIGRLNATDLFVGDQTLAGPVIVSQPLAPTSVKALTILTDAGLTLAADVTTTAGQYYAADITLDRDVRLASETRRLDLTEVGSYATAGLARAVAISADGTLAYLADATSGLVILDVSDPAAPSLVGAVAIPGSASDVALSADGSTAYVTAGASGLQVIDVSNPQSPVLRGSVATDSAAAVAVVPGGQYVAVTSSLGGLFLVDVLDPGTPAVEGSYSGTLAGTAGVAVSTDGSRAYLCDFNDGLVVIDISDPATPLFTAALELGQAGVAADVALSPFGNLAYVTDTRGQLWIVDVTGPTPDDITTFAPAGAGGYLGLEVSADGRTVFIAAFDNGVVAANGLVAVDVSDPTAPAILDTLALATPAFALALAPGGAGAYVADGSGGLRVVDCFTETPSNGRVTFTGTVDGPVSGAGGLTVATTNTIDFQAALGSGGLPLSDVTLAGSRILMPAVSSLIAGTFTVTEGTFSGSGTVGNLVFDPATTLLVGIGSLDPVTGYEQFTVDPLGTVVLDSVALSVSANISVPVGTVLTLIDNQGSAPVSGTFAGLPEGATVVDGGGVFRVSYVGGDGNDVTLEAIAGDIVVGVLDNRVVITLPSTGTTVGNLSTRYFPRGRRLVITVAADGPLTGGGTGVTVNDAAGTVSVRLAQLPGFTGIDVIGGGGTDLITVGPGGINLAAVTRGAADQSVSITTAAGSADTVTITRPVRMKGRGSFTVATPFADSSAGIRLGTTVTAARGGQVYLGDVTLVGPTTVTAAGILFNAAVDGPHRLTVNTTGEAAFLGDIGLAEPLAGMTIQKATSVLVMGGFRLDGTGRGPRANGLVVGRNVKNLFFSSLAPEGIAPAVPPRTIAGFGGSGILFQGGSTGSTIRDVAIIGNGRGMTFQPGSYAGTVVQSNPIADSTRIGISLNGARGLTVGGDGLRDGNAIGSAATGIDAMGNLTGTRVSGNTISLNAGNGIVMRNARGLLVGGTANTIVDNGGWGLIASGTSSGSVVAGNTISGNAFGQVNVRRARGLRVVP